MNRKLIFLLAAGLATLSLLGAAALRSEFSKTAKSTRINRNVVRLKAAQTWMYQIQNITRRGAITALAKTDYPVLVVEPTYTIKGDEDFDVKRMIRRLRTTPGGKRRVILAYIDIGEAESYRTYWDKRWQNIWLGSRGIIRRLAKLGFRQ